MAAVRWAHLGGDYYIILPHSGTVYLGVDLSINPPKGRAGSALWAELLGVFRKSFFSLQVRVRFPTYHIWKALVFLHVLHFAVSFHTGTDS